MVRWIVLFFVVTLMGCSSVRVLPSRSTQKAFGSIDSIEVEQLRISDIQVIEKLKRIHARSKWEPMPTTLPGDLIVIYGLQGGERRFKLVYGAGWIMDTNDAGEIVRRGSLSEADRQWMDDNIRAKLPPKQNVI